MSDPTYMKYIVVPTNQCNYYIYYVCVRHAVSTTGQFHIDRSHNKRLPNMPTSFKSFLSAKDIFDTRGDAEYYAQNVLMPSLIDKKIKELEWQMNYKKKLIDKFTKSKPKSRFATLAKDNP